MNLSKYIEDFLLHCKIEKNLSSKSIKAYKIDLKGFENFIKKENINEINKNDIKQYLNFLFEKDYKIKTIKRKIISVKALFNYLEFEEIVTQNPFKKVKINLKEEKKLPVVLSLDEVEKLFKCLESFSKKDKIFKRNLLIIKLLLITGIRVFELCEIKKEDINFTERYILINGKGRKQRKVYIPNEKTFKLLNEVIKLFNITDGYIFLNKSNKPLTDQTVRSVVKNSCKRCLNKDNITPHIFRHTFATILINNGVDIRHIQFLLGHSSIATTQIYTQLDEKVCKEISIKNPINRIFMK